MALLSLFLSSSNSIDMPKWPKAYKLQGTWSIPYQKIVEPFTVYVDNAKQRWAEIAYSGVSRNVYFVNDKTYNMQPKFDHMTCMYKKGPTEVLQYLPTDYENYQYAGVTVVLGRKCHMWEKKVEMPVNQWFYRVYCDYETLEPVRLWNHGASIRGSHPADYYFDVFDFGPVVDEAPFIIPTGCVGGNSSGPTLRQSKMNTNYCPTKHIDFKGDLPESFSWRNLPNVVAMPRDQANCGSCWAQAAATSISSQISMRTNKTTKVSVQQIVDCTWNDHNFACFDGFTDAAFRVMQQKQMKLVLEDDYPYIGLGGYCPTNNHSMNVIVKDCWQVEPKDVEQLKRALYLYGPVAVAIATDSSFAKYQGPGVFPGKSATLDDLTHAVTLTGWGVAKDGTKYWEIQNSWSDFWGIDGYGLINQDFDHDIGITLDAFVPVIEVV
ncbi:Clan CA, family C1, cathepsin L or H-like cysteine peptidase [Trichomonas vaginalis G3]|uniref:Clan CA, family C1, cathepsin L or H-like cysteine peptidase n=1 Tax=Trichomonas vaginalis (strain ATCC PRA-98 / G3) TaxID=412133 RepID=A2ECZ7_TRIV3|nr:cysteine-type peptidase protein [Trichomonas vaginalis G3]EAY09448.1 Clan CA, family C1, cathepsin L or H-like cysteine peptidase [Trichomonas vaginalis G3]KAI5500656.1 cysteine-type peptidase protein [Trichomonas vaginalis G3]|eukprot:XP_001321671.1 Clan CA, family C1, cathepsin L or H-like cysteine peptidase [Trichomonas vaginalis G3]